MAKENNRSSYFGDVVKKFLAHRLAMMGTIVLLIEVLAVLLLPAIMKLDPYSMDYMAFGVVEDENLTWRFSIKIFLLPIFPKMRGGSRSGPISRDSLFLPDRVSWRTR